VNGEAAGRLADAIRELIEQVAVTGAPAETLERAAASVRGAASELRAADPAPRVFGPFTESDGRDPMSYFVKSPVCGRLNPLAPPLSIDSVNGAVHATVTFNVAYQGPPGCVHGAFVAAVFDELLGIANATSGNPGMTGSLEIRYRRPTPLDTPLRAVARHTGREGRRIFAAGSLYAGDEVTAEAEGVFIEITPARARELFAQRGEEVDHGTAL
jgi:acyl-coenzyme A thioesterase PaaI-like protein